MRQATVPGRQPERSSSAEAPSAPCTIESAREMLLFPHLMDEVVHGMLSMTKDENKADEMIMPTCQRDDPPLVSDE